MIEKLHSHPIYTDNGRSITGFIRPSTSEIVDKLNEIIDVVNGFEVTKSYERGAKDFAEWLAECNKVSEPIKEYTINRWLEDFAEWQKGERQ